MKINFFQRELKRFDSFSNIEINDIFYYSQKIQKLIIVVDFKYCAIFNEIDTKITHIIVTFDIIVVYTNM